MYNVYTVDPLACNSIYQEKQIVVDKEFFSLL